MTEFDAIDQSILQILETDGRITYSDLASRVGLSVAATKRRVDRLREAGVIRGFSAQIDYSKLGWQVEAFTEVRYTGTMAPQDMVRRISNIPEVESASTIAGDPDVLVKIRARDHSHLQDVIERMRRSGATGTKTLIVLESWRRDRRA